MEVMNFKFFGRLFRRMAAEFKKVSLPLTMAVSLLLVE
jgi:hypothetical protein